MVDIAVKNGSFDVVGKNNLDGNVLVFYDGDYELLKFVNVPQTCPVKNAYIVMRKNDTAVKTKLFL